VSPYEALSSLGVSSAVFVATNVDDIVLLAVFFADEHLRARDIVVGQLAGMALLVAASALCALTALVVPKGFIALLGILPLAIGLWSLPSLWRPARGNADDDDAADERERAVEQRTRSPVLAIALVTVANGGDNLAVYIPLFAKEPHAIPLHAAVFAVLTGVFCWAGHWIVNNPLFGARVRRWGRVALPFVLIGLGLYILDDARVLLR
jgi:cadmium resistance protein CadD (predicted permease)